MTKQKALDEAKKITQQLVEKYKPLKVILFGSTVRNDDREPNDLDFLIVKDNIPENRLERTRQVDRMVQTTTAADFLVLKPAELEERVNLRDPFFTQSILGKGVTMYGG